MNTQESCLHNLLKHVSLGAIAKHWPEIEPYGSCREYSGNGYHALYGNRELCLYIDGIEEPFTYVIDIYGDDKILVET